MPGILKFLLEHTSSSPREFVMEVTDKTRADVKVRSGILLLLAGYPLRGNYQCVCDVFEM